MANAGSIIVLLFLYFSTSNCSHRAGEGEESVHRRHRELWCEKVEAHRDQWEERAAHQGGDRGREAGLKWGLQCGPLRSEIRDLRSDPIRSDPQSPHLSFSTRRISLFIRIKLFSHFSTATKLFEPLRMRVIAKVFYYYRISVVRFFFFFAIFLHIYIYIFCINKQESQSHSYSVINIK